MMLRATGYFPGRPPDEGDTLFDADRVVAVWRDELQASGRKILFVRFEAVAVPMVFYDADRELEGRILQARGDVELF